jgi:hypothetical protein
MCLAGTGAGSDPQISQITQISKIKDCAPQPLAGLAITPILRKAFKHKVHQGLKGV